MKAFLLDGILNGKAQPKEVITTESIEDFVDNHENTISNVVIIKYLNELNSLKVNESMTINLDDNGFIAIRRLY